MGNSNAKTVDLENWMSVLPDQVKEKPIAEIAIPGSHDSFTAKITDKSDVAPDAEKILRDLSVLGPIVKEVIARWSITQTYMAAGQLERGIRYFDIRSATKKGTDDIYICHALYSDTVKSCLEEINEFLKTHPKEVVVLDFQHFYGFNKETHKTYVQLIKSTFGSKIAPNKLQLDSTSLNSLLKAGYQVLIVYRTNDTDFFPSSTFPNPWPNTVSKEDLIASLYKGIANRLTDIPFISQCVLTPDADYIISHVFSSLKEKCAIELDTDRCEWIEKQSAGKGGLNIIIADFIELNDNRYVEDVISVNRKEFSN